MDRRDFLRMTGLGLTALALPRWLAADRSVAPNNDIVASRPTRLSSAEKPNIIYVIADDLG